MINNDNKKYIKKENKKRKRNKKEIKMTEH